MEQLIFDFPKSIVGRAINLPDFRPVRRFARVKSFNEDGDGCHSIETTNGEALSVYLCGCPLVTNSIHYRNPGYERTNVRFTVVDEFLLSDESMRRRATKDGVYDAKHPFFIRSFKWHYHRGDFSQYGEPDHYELQIKRWGLQARKSTDEEFEGYAYQTVYTGGRQEYKLSHEQALAGGMYEARVRAVNEVGAGDWGKADHFHFHQESPECFAGTTSIPTTTECL
jgi:hypothetical protein